MPNTVASNNHFPSLTVRERKRVRGSFVWGEGNNNKGKRENNGEKKRGRDEGISLVKKKNGGFVFFRICVVFMQRRKSGS